MSKILVIDDEIKICELIVLVLKKANLEVIYELTGKDGLRRFYSEKPYLVILDLCLKDIYGLDVLKNIKKHDPGCRVIMITASNSTKDMKTAMELGVDNYFFKPFDLYQFRSIILDLL